MKNLLKKINVFALALILIGGVTIASQSAFSESSNVRFSGYGLYTGPTIPGTGVINNTWYDFNAPPAGYQSVCNTSLDACTRTAPNPSSPKVDDGQFDLEEL
ncbi:hypothetical protein SAMN04487898_11535 [Pedobacter sp. ok626]|uniref:hypothetical protein n=1 Tax=Pedobacter sp. ok626 TaxID=1761882 RepID=UPI00088D1BAA|nr:hypothetical protein [Pedobacter sp. ok626]SDL11335.1 hypothetical protein SAMN04487898_11535 [Pedobacter sp. ok626]